MRALRAVWSMYRNSYMTLRGISLWHVIGQSTKLRSGLAQVHDRPSCQAFLEHEVVADTLPESGEALVA